MAKRPRSWHRLVLRLLAALVLFLAGTVALAYYLLGTSSPAPPALTGRLESRTVRVGTTDRSYSLYRPRRPVESPALLIVFHGSMGSPGRIRSETGYGFDQLADRHDFVVAYPQGHGGNWNDCRRAANSDARRLGIDDLGFFDALVARLHRDLNVDRSRIYVAGLSNGAQFVLRLALERPRQIAAAAMFAGALPTAANNDCRAAGAPPPIIIVDGTSDPISPFEGGNVSMFGFASRGPVLSAPATAAHFAQGAGARGPVTSRIEPADPGDPTWVERLEWRIGAHPRVVLLAVHGGGHVVPQRAYRPARLLGRATTAIDGPTEAWRFFAIQPPVPVNPSARAGG